MINRPTRSTYTYRIPLDDTVAMMRLRRFERKEGYDIWNLSSRDVPTYNAHRNIGVVFYSSQETRGDQPNKLEGGTIPGLDEYRYSLDWEPTPETSMLEMRHANGGGTKIRGHQYMGSDDPRIPNNIPIDTVVGWTPGEIKKMFDGEPVPNKAEYSHNPPEMEPQEARDLYHQLIHRATEDGYEECQKKVEEYIEECDHDHVVTTDSSYRPAYCEDCGMGWEDERELNATVEAGEATIVGHTA